MPGYSIGEEPAKKQVQRGLRKEPSFGRGHVRLHVMHLAGLACVLWLSKYVMWLTYFEQAVRSEKKYLRSSNVHLLINDFTFTMVRLQYPYQYFPSLADLEPLSTVRTLRLQQAPARHPAHDMYEHLHPLSVPWNY